MIIQDFCKDWIYYNTLNSNDKHSIDIPHDAMIKEKRSSKSDGGRNIGWFEAYDYVYQKFFFVNNELKQKIITFDFEGIYKDAEVFINGTLAGENKYGYSGFYVNASPHLIYGSKNTLEVRVKNSDQPNSRWYTGTGIYRPVKMLIQDKKHIMLDGIKIRTLEYSPPKIEININTNAEGSIRVEIYDGEVLVKSDSKETSKFKAAFELDIENAKLWSEKSPNLYLCRVYFENDIVDTTFGIRKVECDAKNGLRINGKRTVLKGACVHHDNGLLGAAAYNFSEQRKVKLLKSYGFNAIRSAHNPCSKALLDACDKLGVMVLDEYVDMWYIPKTMYDYSKDFEANYKNDLKSMVDKDYNHPSVIMYSIGNEVSETASKKGIELCSEMTQYLKTLDNRAVTCGINIFFNFLSRLGLGFYSEKKALKAASKNKKRAVGSEFFNNLANRLGKAAMKLGSRLKGSELSTRDAFKKLDVAGYNYGISRYTKDIKKEPDRVILGTETFCCDAFLFIKLAKKYPSIIGDFVWAGFDYIGEVCIGSWEYKAYAKDFSYGVGWLTAGSGRFDITGKPLAEADYMAVMFGHKKLALAVVPADNAFKKHSPSAWKMTNALKSWSYDGYEGKKTLAEVYTKAFRAELYLNNKLLCSKKNNKNGRIVFKLKYYKGELCVKAFNKEGNIDAQCSLKSANDETILRLIPEESVISHNELSYVRLAFTDNNGILKPLIRGEIELQASGGELLALSHACPYNEKGYTGHNKTDTYYGEALAIIKPDYDSKAINITANSSYGKAHATVEIK